MIKVQCRGTDRVRRLAAADVQPQIEWVAAGHLDELPVRIRWSEHHRRLFE